MATKDEKLIKKVHTFENAYSERGSKREKEINRNYCHNLAAKNRCRALENCVSCVNECGIYQTEHISPTNDQFQDNSVHSTSSSSSSTSTSCFPSSIQFILSIYYFYPFCMRLGCLSACMRARTNKPSLWCFALAEVAASTYTTNDTPFTAHLLR